MPSSRQDSEFDRQLQPRARVYHRPRLALRRRAQDHPMVMFAVFVVASFGSMALMPSSGPAFASMATTTRSLDGALTTPKTARLPLSETDIACQGQAWGEEGEACLGAIAKETGERDVRKVRLIANAELVRTTPNIF